MSNINIQTEITVILKDTSRSLYCLKTERLELTIGEIEYTISVCHLTGGLIINKDANDASLSITPRVSNEILIK